MLYELQDRVYLEYKQWWFVWEPAWESFRPIEGVLWNGTSFVIKDEGFCSDPTSQTYGYGSDKMRQLCGMLQDKFSTNPQKVSTLPFGNEWFRDRFVSLTRCAPRDVQSWKRMVQNKPRTCRNKPRGKKLTRRTRT